MKKGLTELVFIVDKSGSMSGLETDTIGGYNAMLKKQEEVEGDCVVTTVLFNNRYELVHDRIDLRAVSAITTKDYQVGGTTALIDAIGRTIDKIGNAQKHTAHDYRAEQVMVVIITDGEENASREYSAKAVKKQINDCQRKYGWEFVFLGANIDAVETAGQFGISPDRAVDYLADQEGTRVSYQAMAETVKDFRMKGFLDVAHLNKIRKDTKRRKTRK